MANLPTNPGVPTQRHRSPPAQRMAMAHPRSRRSDEPPPAPLEMIYGGKK